ncbi:putative retrotransposon hot spot protein (RHS) [Trypanosoma cruzi]|uniref:Putative retrotransposon hot spot protein (RHS) n=1 Tax=Trypanosoma cruzi TaxID=5693 RepID=A0A2V2V9A1_TRYCR|nr:putative retrotransposon hot spot protein (RHS) [Trypanosoma cruzi]
MAVLAEYDTGSSQGHFCKLWGGSSVADRQGRSNRVAQPSRWTDFTPKRRVLIGTPGIGKSVAAGSYLLYQLLHCDVEKSQVVVHCFGGGDAYVSDKTTRAVTRYGDEDMCISELKSLRGPWEECVYYLRCGKGGNAATETFCAHFWMGHDCGVIPKGKQL